MFVNLAGVGEGASDRVKALEEGSRVAGCSYTPRQGTSRSRGITGYVKKKKSTSTTAVVWIAHSLTIRVGGCCVA